MGICTSKSDYLQSLTLKSDVLSQIENNICKIKIRNKNLENGFFCVIPFLSQSSLIPVLITHNISEIEHIKAIEINFKDLNNNKIEKKLNLNESRLVFTKEDINITIIEIIPNIDGINTKNFLEIDENIFQNINNDIYKEKTIYLLEYINEETLSYSMGELNEIKDKAVKYLCIKDIQKPSYFPILLFSNNKIIAINNKNNEGIHFRFIIEEFNKIQTSNNNLYINNNIQKNNRNMIEMLIENSEENEIDEDNNIFRICNIIEHSLNNNNDSNNNKLKNINQSFLELYVNNNIYNYKNFIKPPKGILNIKIIINALMSDCRNLFLICCKNLISLNLSSFDCRNVSNMSYMFRNCEKLKFINFSKFNTKNVTNMSRMFMDCKNLTNLDLLSFDTMNVKKMNYMFHGCENLTDLNLSNFNTMNVKEMNDMFHGCKNLVNINLSSFDTKNVINMSRMFMDCDNLINLNLSSFDTINVANMSRMFMNSKNLENLNLSSFNTKNISDINRIFFDCKNLKFLNLSLFEINNDANISYMFNGCKNLKEINISSKINSNNILSQLKADGINAKIIYI